MKYLPLVLGLMAAPWMGSVQGQSEIPGHASGLRLMAVGDMMLGTNYPSASTLPPSGGVGVLAKVSPILRQANLTFGNLEGVLHGDDVPVAKLCNNPKLCYAFKSPDEYAGLFDEAGFDLLSIANNHIGDFGDRGKNRTCALLDSVGISYAGLQTHPTAILKENGLLIGFTAFAPNRGTLQIADLDLLERTVRTLADTCDIVIVSFHGGAEGAEHQHISPGTEIFLGENRGDPVGFARTAIDAGADVVLGHGPHVPRAVDLYKGRFIAYSLGNFATYARFSLKGVKAYAPILDLNLNADGSFDSGRIHSAIQLGPGIPTPDDQERAYLNIKELTQADRPDSGLQFPGDGLITH